MKKRSRAKISQCMIVKNEEKNIEKALSWGKGVVSEQIVVDTGSTDRTVELAEKMGAKVYHFEWIDDFSAAKNFAISKAKYEWIALLDADEYFSEEDAKKLLFYIRQLNDSKYDIIATAWVHINNDGRVIAVGTQTRIFRNHPGLRYKNRIHEQIVPIDGRPHPPVDATTELSIFHTGYGEAENEVKTSSGRNLKMIEAELVDRPDDYDMLGYLGDELYSMHRLEEAKEAFHKAIALMPESLPEHDMRSDITFVKLLEILAYQFLQDDKEILSVYNDAVKRLPKESDFDYMIGKYYAARGEFDKGEKYLKLALQKLEQFGYTSKAMMLTAQLSKAYELLSVCCYNNGNLKGCVDYTTALLKTDKYLMSTLYLMLTAFKIDESAGIEGGTRASDVVAFLGRNLYDFTNLKDRLFVLKAAMKAEYATLVERVRALFTPEELQSVDRALNV